MPTTKEIWEYPVPDMDDQDGTRGTAHALKQTWRYSIQAAVDASVARRIVEQLAAASGVVVDSDAIAEAVAAELAERLAA